MLIPFFFLLLLFLFLVSFYVPLFSSVVPLLLFSSHLSSFVVFFFRLMMG